MSSIASEIRSVCKHDFGWTDNQCDLIRHVLDSEFKDPRYSNKGGSRSALENPNSNSVTLHDLINSDSIESLSKEQIQTLDEKVQTESKRRMIALLREPESIHDIAEQYEQRISINDINVKSEIDESTQVNFNKLVKSLSLFRNNFMKINKKIEKYPLTDDNVRRELNYSILDFKTRIDAINNVSQSLADDRGTLSPGRWNFMKRLFQQDNTLGGFASMLKQKTLLSDKPRPPTTKGIKKADTKEFEEYQKAVDFTDFAMSIRTLIYHLGNWYDFSNISKYSDIRATHKGQLHDKRSESA